MWESSCDFQGRWEGWETCIRFSTLSMDRHFHRLAAPFARQITAKTPQFQRENTAVSPQNHRSFTVKTPQNHGENTVFLR
jgi:hypothetical protein